MDKKRYIAVACAAIVVSMPLSAAATNTPARRAVEADIARLAKDAGGEVGVFARHTESGSTLSLASDVRFPMASTFKVAVAGAILAKVDAGSLTLAQLVPINRERVLMSGGIAEIFPFEGLSVSVHNLIETMLTRSDNTATNVLTALAGGPAAVTDWVRTQGVQDMRVDGDTNDIVRRFFDIPPGPVPLNEQLKSLVATHPEIDENTTRPNPHYDDDPRDTTTPEAMVALLSRIAAGHVLSPRSTDVLLGAMQRNITGLKRLRALLPPGTVVKDKTGTIGGTLNDVGIIDLPDGRGHIIVAVYIKKSPKPFGAREQVIAQIGRSIYDYMLIESAASQETKHEGH